MLSNPTTTALLWQKVSLRKHRQIGFKPSISPKSSKYKPFSLRFENRMQANKLFTLDGQLRALNPDFGIIK